MTSNPVTANLLMVFFLAGGAFVILTSVKQEVFPAFEREQVVISVAYPKASPEEIEKGIILAIEEAVSGQNGIKKLHSRATEGYARVTADLEYDIDMNKVAAEIKNAVDRITSFPLDAERPTVKLLTIHREVLSLVLYGDQDEKILRSLIESVRDDLLKEKNITQIELEGVRSLEISVEVSKRALRAYGLTINRVANAIKQTAIEMPGGSVKTQGGEILIRMSERRELGREFEDITILSGKDGTRVRLGDIAEITDGFEDLDIVSTFNGKPSVAAKVFRVGDQTPLGVAATVKTYKEHLDSSLPADVKAAIRFDRSELFHQRVDLLKENALLGLLLVFGLLGLFLEIRLAFWVTMGIPISFLGSFIFLPIADVSVNMISLFAFIVTLGMVVDDAIVIGENIHYHRTLGKSPLDAAIKGVWEVAVPVFFSIMTTVVAFSPLFFVPGTMGKVFFIMPAVIVTVLLISLFESIFILPAHLGHLKEAKTTGFLGFLYRRQQKVGSLVERTAADLYGPLVRLAVRHHWITWAIGICMLVVALGVVLGDRVKLELFSKLESDWTICTAVLPHGVAFSDTQKVRVRIEQAAEKVINELSDGHPERFMKGISAYVVGSSQVNVVVSLLPSEQRNTSVTEFLRMWREATGEIAGLENIKYRDIAGGPGGGKPVHVQLSHNDIEVLKLAAADLAVSLKEFSGVYDIDDGFTQGKSQLNFTLKPEARSLGISSMDLAGQISEAFWGAEALRQQRGRDMVRVMVRHPKNERNSEYDVEELLIRTPRGGELPLTRAAYVVRGTAYTTINRVDGQRTIDVTAELDGEVTSSIKVVAALAKTNMPRIVAKYPGLDFGFEGEEKSGNEALDSLFTNFIYVLFVMYALIAIPFRSYVQPLVVLSAIPFGFVGAVLGHMAMGYNLSLISLMGILALSGVVVNDSIVLIHTTNRFREEGMDAKEAICNAGIRRFRPILLTSLTTFLGLTPMIFETSFQAKMLIPMAISLGFGVLFATVIILLIVPSIYIIIEDVQEILADIARDFVKILRAGLQLIGIRFD
ncbi:MAG: efflux RND transporter permease subunit [Proteobacteria bacterium]|nr:efflux RND transporter permease subunit [Pseudomonadota bacterium]